MNKKKKIRIEFIQEILRLYPKYVSERLITEFCNKTPQRSKVLRFCFEHFGGHGIISIDIIPAPICVRPKGGQIP